MLKIKPFLILFIFHFSCNSENQTSVQQLEPVEKPAVDLELVQLAPEDLPAGCKVSGEIEDVFSWLDYNGKNYIVRSKDCFIRRPEGPWGEDLGGVQYIYADHFCEIENKQIKTVHSIGYGIKNCFDSLLIYHIPESLTITDLDSNGFAEVTLIARKACSSKQEPMDQILFLWENDLEYCLRGFSELKPNEGGTYDDSEFANAPAVFESHAKDLWAIYKK